MNIHEQKANIWMSENPEAYELFEKFALQMCWNNQRFGAKMVAERVRWETKLMGKDKDGFKWNNNYTAYVARKFMKNHSAFNHLINVRKTK